MISAKYQNLFLDAFHVETEVNELKVRLFLKRSFNGSCWGNKAESHY